MPGFSRQRRSVLLVAAIIVLLTGGTGIVFAVRQPSSPAAANPVESTFRIVPAAVAAIPLTDQNGQATDLAAFHGRVVIFADFLTSCQEVCPITTGALSVVYQSLSKANLLNRVSIVEVTVDPSRDTPSRLLAYQNMVNVHWSMMTGSAVDLSRLWSFFGVQYGQVAEGNPPGIDWQTGQPYAYDVDHSDDAFVLGPTGNERALSGAIANVGGVLPKGLASMLDSQGVQNLKDPGFASWTPSDMLQAVSAVLGRNIPLA